MYIPQLIISSSLLYSLVPFPILLVDLRLLFACHFTLVCLESPLNVLEFHPANSGGVVVGTQVPACVSWVCLPIFCPHDATQSCIFFYKYPSGMVIFCLVYCLVPFPLLFG